MAWILTAASHIAVHSLDANPQSWAHNSPTWTANTFCIWAMVGTAPGCAAPWFAEQLGALPKRIRDRLNRRPS